MIYTNYTPVLMRKANEKNHDAEGINIREHLISDE